MKKLIVGIFILLMTDILPWFNAVYGQTSSSTTDNAHSTIIQFILCSDVHFGLRKEIFRGRKNVTAEKVNAAMIEQMNLLPGLQLPNDNGVNEGRQIKWIDALMITGDIANRQEIGIQSAKKSWKQFDKTYLSLLTLKTPGAAKTPVLMTPGNHDVSNAIGFRRPMRPTKDATSLRSMYNLMMPLAVQKNKNEFHPDKDRIHYSVNIGNAHCMFIQLWPDSSERKWMEEDLSAVSSITPVFIFTHSIPDVEARFFVNPNGTHDINDNDKFENLLTDTFKDGRATTDTAFIEQRTFAAFVKTHPNIKAYFHGHNNYTQFYDWRGPDNDIALHCFRVDSPMKGRYSAADETKLSFELISFDTATKQLTVRECLWNREPLNPSHPVQWGASTTVSLN